MKTRNEIIEFARVNDYAYLYGAGKMFANDDETREEIANLIESMNYIIPVDDLDEECATELADEEGTVYKCYSDNVEAIFISVY